MTYCLTSDLSEWVLPAYLEAAEAQNAGILEKCVQSVSAEIDDALRGRFVLPLTTIPETIRRLCGVLAAYRALGDITSLVATEAGSDNEFLFIQREASKAARDLADLRAGKLDALLIEAGAETPAADSGSMRVLAPPPLFGPGVWEKF